MLKRAAVSIETFLCLHERFDGVACVFEDRDPRREIVTSASNSFASKSLSEVGVSV